MKELLKMSKIIAIGDTHGEFDKLLNLFERISYTKDDTIIFLGDYIDRGSNSKEVIDFIINLKDKCNLVTLKGNHELFYEDSLKGNYRMFDSWMNNGGTKTLKSYDRRSFEDGHYDKALSTMRKTHGEFFNNLQLTYETENHIFVHGYLDSEKDLKDQDYWACLWGRYDDIKPHKSGKIVVVGHTIQHSGVKDDIYKVCIDTGSFKPGGYITAMIIDGNKTNYVNSI